MLTREKREKKRKKRKSGGLEHQYNIDDKEALEGLIIG